MISDDVKADVKQQELEELVAVSCNFRDTSKLEIKWKTRAYFSFFFLLGILSSLRLSCKNKGIGVFFLNNQNPLIDQQEFMNSSLNFDFLRIKCK